MKDSDNDSERKEALADLRRLTSIILDNLEEGSQNKLMHPKERRLQTVKRTHIDQTGVGEYFIEEARKSGVKLGEGTTLTVPAKEDIMFHLRLLMEEGRLHFAYDADLINEMNAERFQITKTGQTQFSNPNGIHDDRLWEFALAVYSARFETPTYHPVGAAGRNPNSLMPNLPRSIWKR